MAIDTSNLTEEQKIGLEFAKRGFQKKHGLTDEELEKFISTPSNLKLMLGPTAEHMHGFWEHMFEGLNPNEGMSQYVACMDLGLEYGGIGHVMFKLYCEEIEPEADKN